MLCQYNGSVHHCESKIYTFLNNEGAVQTRVCCSEKVQSDLSERPQPTDSAAGIQAVSVMSSGLSFSSFFFFPSRNVMGMWARLSLSTEHRTWHAYLS